MNRHVFEVDSMFRFVPAALFGFVCWFVTVNSANSETRMEEGEFKLSQPVVCKSVKGFRDYVELKPPELTTFDKLLVYVEPSGFALKADGEKKKANLVQNARVRAKGSKKYFFERNELFKYEPELTTGRESIFLAASIGFKNVKPGEYVLELETIDKSVSPEQKIVQQIEFVIINRD